MRKPHHGTGQDHIEEHSLPGTNQAGKEAKPREGAARGSSRDGDEPRQEHRKDHSLPGTNQAGAGPDAPERDDHR